MKYLFILISLFCLTLSSNVMAEETKYSKQYSASDVKHFGLGFSLGIPEGIALGLIIRPNIKWIHFEAAGTYNAIAPGIKGGVTLDPTSWVIGPSLTLEAGHSFMGKVPTKSAEVDITYYNLYAGLEFGSQSNFRFFLRGGPSYVIMHGNHVEDLFGPNDGNIKFTNSSLKGWFVPTGTMGFALFF